MNEMSDLAIATGIAFMLRIFLGMLAFFAIAAIVQYCVRRIDASRPTQRSRRQEFNQVKRHARARRAMATDITPRFPQVSAIDLDELARRAGEP